MGPTALSAPCDRICTSSSIAFIIIIRGSALMFVTVRGSGHISVDMLTTLDGRRIDKKRCTKIGQQLL